jgi:hypothetical protein
MTKSVVTALFGTALVIAGVLGAGVGLAYPAPAAPGYCGGDPLDCYENSAPPTPAEQFFVKSTNRYLPNATAEQLLRYARATCVMLHSGLTTTSVVTDLAHHLGTSMDMADQVMDGAMVADCPNLTIGADGVAR